MFKKSCMISQISKATKYINYYCFHLEIKLFIVPHKWTVWKIYDHHFTVRFIPKWILPKITLSPSLDINNPNQIIIHIRKYNNNNIIISYWGVTTCNLNVFFYFWFQQCSEVFEVSEVFVQAMTRYHFKEKEFHRWLVFIMSIYVLGCQTTLSSVQYVEERH